eukprot:g26497.t1
MTDKEGSLIFFPRISVAAEMSTYITSVMFHVRGRLMVISGNQTTSCNEPESPSLVAKTRMKADVQRVPGLDAHNACASVGAFVMYVSGAARPCRGFGCCELSFAVCFDAYLKPTNTGSYDYFGLAVSVSGNTLVVGAYYEDSCATGINGNEADNSCDGAGAVYVFVRNEQTGQWFQQRCTWRAAGGKGNTGMILYVAAQCTQYL